MAFKTQSRKRNRSMTNLLDASMGSASLTKSGQNSANYPQFANSEDFENDSFTDNTAEGGTSSNLNNRSPPLDKKKSLKKRNFSQANFFMSALMIDKSEAYAPDDPIEEKS